jgi:hypothetical protein
MTVHRSLTATRLVLLSIALSGGAQATNYWSYSYQGIDVMASSDAALARTVAHNVHRVERVARTLIDWDTAARLPPTPVYMLHHPTFVELMQPPQFSTRISGTQVTLGTVDPWVGKVILTWQLKFIPTRDLLTLNIRHGSVETRSVVQPS